jgi:hypothetical protein
MDHETEKLILVMLFDKDFHVRTNPADTEGVKNGLRICNLQQ